MEGVSVWLFFAAIALYALMAVSVLPALAALAFLIAGRRRPALILFATALLCEALTCAALCFLMIEFRGSFLHGLPTGLTGLSLLLAGAGQFVAALRGRPYRVALGLAAGAVAVIVAGTPIVFSVLAEVSVPWEWLNRLPEWNSLPVAAASVLLAVASLTWATLAPREKRQGDGGDEP